MNPIAAVLFAMSALVVGCTGARAAVPESLQGIVEHEERVLGFAVGGRVEVVRVRPGDSVEAGAALVVLDDALDRSVRAARVAEVDAARARLRLVASGPRAEEIRAAEAELRAVQAQSLLVDARIERQTTLVASGALAPVTLDDLTANQVSLDGREAVLNERVRGLRRGARGEEIDAAEAALRAAEAGLAIVETRLLQHVLASPGHFTVTDVHASVGEIAGPGTAGVTVADLDHPFVEIFVPEGRMAMVAVGQRASVRIDGLRESLPAVVEHVANRTEFTPRFLFSETERPNLVLRVRIRIEDPRHRLRAGLPALVTLDGPGRAR